MRVFDWHLQLSISIHAPRAGSDYLQQDAPAAPGYFNPRSPCGERLCPFRPPSGSCTISIHAPRAGSDIAPRSYAVIISRISIHAPRAGSDSAEPSVTKRTFGISIHAPRAGSDHSYRVMRMVKLLFQSTLPVRGATNLATALGFYFNISIHAPRAGSDLRIWQYP